MRCVFYEQGESEPHLFTVEEMQPPNVGESVWINGGLGRSGDFLPEHLRRHVEMVVVRRSYSLIVAAGPYRIGAHAEILLAVRGETPQEQK